MFLTSNPIYEVSFSIFDLKIYRNHWNAGIGVFEKQVWFKFSKKNSIVKLVYKEIWKYFELLVNWKRKRHDFVFPKQTTKNYQFNIVWHRIYNFCTCLKFGSMQFSVGKYLRFWTLETLLLIVNLRNLGLKLQNLRSGNQSFENVWLFERGETPMPLGFCIADPNIL